MTNGKIIIALGLVVGAVLIQTTVFRYIRPFDLAPALGILMVIAVSRFLEAEQSMLVAFTGGFLQDLLGGSPLGLWAITFTVVAFVTIKVRDKEVGGPPIVLAGVFVLSLMGLVIYVILGTLFGQGIINRPGLIWHLLVPSLFNVLLAYPAFWIVKVTLRPQERSMIR
jgi:rod shape-determining protein MreD